MIFSASGIVALIAVIAAIALAGGGGTPNDKGVAKAMSAAGCTLKTAPNKSRKHVTSLDDEDPVQHRPAVERISLLLAGDLGLLHDAGQPDPGRPQRGARRRHPLVGEQGALVDDRGAPRLLQRKPERDGRHAATRASATRSRSPRGRRRRAATAKDTPPCARPSTRRPSPRSGTRTAARARSASRSTRSRRARRAGVPGEGVEPSRPALGAADFKSAAYRHFRHPGDGRIALRESSLQ